MAKIINIAADVRGLAATTTKKSTLNAMKDFLKKMLKNYYASCYENIEHLINQGIEGFNSYSSRIQINAHAAQMANLSEWYEGIDQCTSQKGLKEFLDKSDFWDGFCGGVEALDNYMAYIAEEDEKWIVRRIKKFLKKQCWG